MAGTADSPLASVIVVAADSGPLLRECVDAVLASTAPFELLLVDNASSDGEIERIAAAHAADARLHVHRNPANLGFGPACNRGAALARGDLLVFLNPDCNVGTDTLACLRDVLRADPCIGLLGVTVCSPDGAPARGNRRRDPSLRRALMTASGLSRLEAHWPALAGVEMPAAVDETGIEVVDAVSGACMALPREAFERVGGFDEAYFLHVEDLDLCRRVRDSGRAVAIAKSIRVVHAQGSSSRARPLFVSRHKHRGMWRYFRRFDPAARAPPLRAAVWLGIWSHFVFTAPLKLARWR